MAKINFPSSPVNGQTYDQNGVYYTYDSTLTAWVTALVSKPYDASRNTQIIFNDSGFANGSNGMVFDKASNTAYLNNVAVTLNVSATYFKGNGAFLTGVASDLSPAYNTANDAYTIANAAFTKANTGGGGLTVGNETASSSTFYPVFSNTSSGAGTSNVSSTKLYFVPSTGTLSATVFNSLSDITYKTNIQPIDGVQLLSLIRPVSFTWSDTGIVSYGVIAQELEKNLPHLVETNDSGIKSVSYIPMVAMLIDVVQKQEKRIEKLEQLLNNQK